MALLKLCKCGKPIPIGQKRCDVCDGKQKEMNRERYKSYDILKRDKQSSAFYKSSAWQHLRQQALTRDIGLCQHCLSKKQITLAEMVDHIIPIKIDQDLKLSLGNLQSLCNPCHILKTASDRTKYIQSYIVPNWLKPSAIPLTIVCGPSGSGKTSFVLENSDPEDMVIDLDWIKSSLSGLPWYQSNDDWLKPALWERNRRLEHLSSLTSGKAWFIVSAPKAEERRRWAAMLKPERVIVLEVPLNICKERLMKDERRSSQWQRYVEVSRNWWLQYQRNLDEERISVSTQIRQENSR
jgi:5-methylcytosine-specific restriction endonuclease McrA/predicted kinase